MVSALSRRRAAIVLSGSLGVGQLLVAVAYAIAARALGIETFGGIVALIALASVLAGVLDYGLAAYLLRELAAQRMDGSDARLRLFRRMALVGCGAVLTCTIAGLAELNTAPAFEATATVASLVVATMCMQSAQVILRARGRMLGVAVALLVDRIVLTGLVVCASILEVSMTIGLPGAVIAGLVVDALLCVTLSRQWSWRVFRNAMSTMGSPRKWFRSWSGTSSFGAAAMLGALQQVDVTFLALVAGPRASGEYGAVSRWTNPMTLPSSAVTQTEAANAAESARTIDALRSVAGHWWIFAGSVLAAVSVALFARPIAEAVLGREYSSSSSVLAVLALAIIPTVFAQPLAMVLQSRGEDKFVARLLAGGLVVRLALVVALAATLGALAAAAAVAAQQVVILVSLGHRTRRLIATEGRP